MQLKLFDKNSVIGVVDHRYSSSSEDLVFIAKIAIRCQICSFVASPNGFRTAVVLILFVSIFIHSPAYLRLSRLHTYTRTDVCVHRLQQFHF